MQQIPSIKELRGLCQSTAPNPARESKVGLFSRVFSIYFTRLFIPTIITPTDINILVVAVYYIGVFLFFLPQYWVHILASLIVFFSIILDGCDGELARYRKVKDDVAAAFNEPVSHDIQYGLAFLVIAAALYMQGAPAYLLILGAMASISKLEYRLLQVRIAMLPKPSVSPSTSENSGSSAHNILAWINKNLLSSTGVFLVMFISAIIDRPDLFIWFFAVGYIGSWLFLFLREIRRQKKTS